MLTLSLLSLVVPAALASRPSDPSVERVAVLAQPVPTEVPADPSAPLACTVTWTLPTTGTPTVAVAPGCPMEAAVGEAARQWRLDVRADAAMALSARFAYDAAAGGWSTQLATDPGMAERGGATVEVERRPPNDGDLRAALGAAGVTEATCRARFLVDAAGRPTQMATWGCAEPLQAWMLERAHAWRFAPVVVGGAPVPAALSIEMKMRSY